MRKFKLLTIFTIVMTMVILMLPQSALAVSDNFGVKESANYTGKKAISDGNRVYFYNMSGGGAALSDFIIIESNGHWGLIDSGHRKSNIITDGKASYSCLQSGGLSSQVSGKNGVDAAKYMVETLGVNHLDFIIGTHAHSDHLGGIPEISNLVVNDRINDVSYNLVDKNTVYIYKPYNAINKEQDDISGYTTYSWHNQAYSYQAIESMKNKNAQLVDISKRESLPNISGIQYARYKGNTGSVTDTLNFKFGEMDIALYNLYTHNTHIDENVNSIVAVINYKDNVVASMADINVEERSEQKIAKAIRDRFGVVDVMKAPHHGVTRGSNSKELYDYLQPKKVIATRGITNVKDTQTAGVYANAMKYSKKQYGTLFYENGASGYGLTVLMDKTGAPVYNLIRTKRDALLISADSCIGDMSYANGWSNWDTEWTFENGTKTTYRNVYYFNNNEYLTGWYNWNSNWYLMSYSDGAMMTGWYKTTKGIWYYFNPTVTDSDFGAMRTGWQKINGKWYYFNDNGEMQTGWIKLNGIWYYLNYDGSMATYTQTINGKTYYFNGSGEMQTGWIKFNFNGNWRYFNSDGSMATGWVKSNNKWYLMAYKDGFMVKGWYPKTADEWYYLNESSGEMATGKNYKVKTPCPSANKSIYTYDFDSKGVCVVK